MLDIKITRTATPKAKPTDETKLGFGKKFSDHMFVMDYTEGSGWRSSMPCAASTACGSGTATRRGVTVSRSGLRIDAAFQKRFSFAD